MRTQGLRELEWFDQNHPGSKAGSHDEKPGRSDTWVLCTPRAISYLEHSLMNSCSAFFRSPWHACQKTDQKSIRTWYHAQFQGMLQVWPQQQALVKERREDIPKSLNGKRRGLQTLEKVGTLKYSSVWLVPLSTED